MKKLIIWDFDGVIADSEKLWVSVWVETLKKEKNLQLSDEEKLNLLVGVSDKTKKELRQIAFCRQLSCIFILLTVQCILPDTIPATRSDMRDTVRHSGSATAHKKCP